jgi:PST family polysaccharide transporter
MAINALLAVIGPVLMAQNKVVLELYAQILSLLFMLPVLHFTSQHSLQAVAWGVVVIYLLRWWLLVIAILHTINIKLSELLDTLFWPMICATAVSASIYAIDQLLGDLSALPRLVADIGSSLFIMIFLMRIFGKRILLGFHGGFLLAHGRIPKKLCLLLGV